MIVPEVGMDRKHLYVNGGDFDVETHQFEFLFVSEEDPLVMGNQVIIDRTVIIRLLEKGYCLQLLFPAEGQLNLVIVDGQPYLRTDLREIPADYIEDISITLKP
jgi:hypothetical protein